MNWSKNESLWVFRLGGVGEEGLMYSLEIISTSISAFLHGDLGSSLRQKRASFSQAPQLTSRYIHRKELRIIQWPAINKSSILAVL
jgi:hypothetical protein